MSFDRLPFLKDGVQVHYEGSIDKRGGNADWDWWLYQDERGEWVLFDVDGPGCIYNFVQHRYPVSPEPTFRFYFDGEAEPRFEITPKEFGRKPPLVEPLAAIFVGDDNPPQGRGPIWVVRSFVPMPFARSCRVTSTVKLQGNDRSLGEGGWGHIMYHSYTCAEGVETFTGREDYKPLVDLWNRVGEDPKPTAGNVEVRTAATVEPGAAVALLDLRGAGSVAAIHLEVKNFQRRHLHALQLRMIWDDESAPAVLAPLGAFFGNELGHRPVRYLSHGLSPEGRFYCYWPMPFWRSARIEIVNDGEEAVEIAARVVHKPVEAMRYPAGRCGYFRTTPYYPSTPVVPGQDTTIGTARGQGHVVGGLVTGLPHVQRYVSCEGDVRVYLDGLATPQVESDGSESWACYGWGFVSPGSQNPVSGYDGSGPPHYSFSMTRLCPGDWYPFRTELRFGIEAGEQNNWPMRHSGLVFYYGTVEPGMGLSDEVDIGNADSELAHEVTAEGVLEAGWFEARDESGTTGEWLKDYVRCVSGASEFSVNVSPGNQGVRLRRRSNQERGRQRARVYVDGQLVGERSWYVADHNPYRRWLEDEFEIPPSYSAGKTRIRVRLEFVSSGDAPGWSEAHYWAYSHAPAWHDLPEGLRTGPRPANGEVP